jgi:hypothetical protein
MQTYHLLLLLEFQSFTRRDIHFLLQIQNQDLVRGI